jgi:hypothetical protein
MIKVSADTRYRVFVLLPSIIAGWFFVLVTASKLFDARRTAIAQWLLMSAIFLWPGILRLLLPPRPLRRTFLGSSDVAAARWRGVAFIAIATLTGVRGLGMLFQFNK